MEDTRRLIFNQETEEDQIVSLSLRPASLKDFIGQKSLMENLLVSLQAAKKRKSELPACIWKKTLDALHMTKKRARRWWTSIVRGCL